MESHSLSPFMKSDLARRMTAVSGEWDEAGKTFEICAACQGEFERCFTRQKCGFYAKVTQGEEGTIVELAL